MSSELDVSVRVVRQIEAKMMGSKETALSPVTLFKHMSILLKTTETSRDSRTLGSHSYCIRPYLIFKCYMSPRNTEYHFWACVTMKRIA
jgi:hypothetical protein